MITERNCPKLVTVWDSINSYRIYNGNIDYEEITSFLKNPFERKRWIKANDKIIQTLFAPKN